MKLSRYFLFLLPVGDLFFLHPDVLTFAYHFFWHMCNLLAKQQPQLTEGFGLSAGSSTSRALACGRLTPPTMPIAFPLQVPSVTFTPDCFSFSIAVDSFDDVILQHSHLHLFISASVL
jgi:hypothetical protein